VGWNSGASGGDIFEQMKLLGVAAKQNARRQLRAFWGFGAEAYSGLPSI